MGQVSPAGTPSPSLGPGLDSQRAPAGVDLGCICKLTQPGLEFPCCHPDLRHGAPYGTPPVVCRRRRGRPAAVEGNAGRPREELGRQVPGERKGHRADPSTLHLRAIAPLNVSRPVLVHVHACSCICCASHTVPMHVRPCSCTCIPAHGRACILMRVHGRWRKP